MRRKQPTFLKFVLPLFRLSAFVFLAGLLLGARFAAAQAKDAPMPRETWSAQWISHPTAPLRDPITMHFRKSIELTSVPAHFVVHVSGDNRFVLYLNGQRVGDGPARGDFHCRTVPIAEATRFVGDRAGAITNCPQDGIPMSLGLFVRFTQNMLIASKSAAWGGKSWPQPPFREAEPIEKQVRWQERPPQIGRKCILHKSCT